MKVMQLEPSLTHGLAHLYSQNLSCWQVFIENQSSCAIVPEAMVLDLSSQVVCISRRVAFSTLDRSANFAVRTVMK